MVSGDQGEAGLFLRDWPRIVRVIGLSNTRLTIDFHQRVCSQVGLATPPLKENDMDVLHERLGTN